MLSARDITFSYGRRPPVLEHVDLDLAPDEVLGLQGPSGRGKSTLGKILAGWIRRFDGEVRCDGEPLDAHRPCRVQYINQNPELAVNPDWRMGDVLTECWEVDAETRHALGIQDPWLARHPHELSGGELQRFCIARVLHPELRYLVADEMTTMLDPLTQAQIWHTLLGLCRERGTGLLVVSHNPALVARLCDRVVPLD